jgi:predicted nucleotide-binding protein
VHGILYFGEGPNIREFKQEVKEYVERAIDGLISAIKHIEEKMETNSNFKIDTSAVNKIFVVHGHDHGSRETVARFIEKLGLTVVILDEMPNNGASTVIEKLVEHAKEVAFAIIIMTPDDLGGVINNPSQMPRARQNVIFEFGYFIGKIGRNKVCILSKGEFEIPSDFSGVLRHKLEESDWRSKLEQELNVAGLQFNQ